MADAGTSLQPVGVCHLICGFDELSTGGFTELSAAGGIALAVCGDLFPPCALQTAATHLMKSLFWDSVNAALPRIRDFRGVNPRGFDGRGSYTMGVKDQTIFPEVELDKIKHNLGMDVTIVTTANTDAEAKELLKLLGMPFSS